MMFLPSLRMFTLGDVVMQGPPGECPGYIFSGRVIVKINVPISIRKLEVVFHRWLSLKRATRRAGEQRVAYKDVLYVGSQEPMGASAWGRGEYEFFFQMVLPGHLCETMYTEHKRVAYEVRATLTTDGSLGTARRSAAEAVAVKRVPYFGAVWESIANDMVHVTAVWRSRIEMCALGCSRVQRDDQPLRVRGVVRALEKGFRLVRVGFILEERTRTRLGGASGGVKCTSSVAACRYLRARDGVHGDWHGALIVDQMAFDVELKIPKAYGKIQYDVKHGSVTVSHRLAFVVAVVDQLGHRTSLRLFTPLHIMPHDWIDSGDELPSYMSSFGDRVLLRAETQSCAVPLGHVETPSHVDSHSHSHSHSSEWAPLGSDIVDQARGLGLSWSWSSPRLEETAEHQDTEDTLARRPAGTCSVQVAQATMTHNSELQ
ncbi:hypothetical protein LPJ64_002114 [Coemansia asiatica]|uniref:Arrestin-like N-terminal domain-containing protein n=1 Tax=Coemansia asiatica TaxID=1052880 RepID=A0A9W7XM88_9FUNG|nr:hypothetical protein LPJ64_002114 [Coemansia asiatica]